ncbi:MAG: 3-oxoacyl-[acyl-carrier-protein] reductase FabG [Alphaproteobacteria bacterium MarineAlpha9_Bin2]|nr:MAG: 3-oxoacyl-[acyl-carrier-protein] reductase FabG [Alphaproteobacteria bacterium MarineAlpha9_Bin1]PPR30924.1 MAG: 3-oxoacyl-[acyl-carrier-protein] reductase FabG [Alphaproteobacteria bacterium MarineAlpha9_Bin2]
MSLSDKVALVTGGGSGIGKAIAKALLAEGCKVIINGRNEEKLEQAKTELGSNVESMVCDVTDEGQVENTFSSIISNYDRCDILINNAGMAAKAKAHEMKYETWKKVINVNLNGAFLCAREAMKIMIKQKSGRIINIGSISGQMSRPENAAYTASKFGLEGLTRALALEGRDHGIAVSILHPGNVGTDIWKGREEIAEREGLIPLEDIGKLAITMLSMSPNVNILGSVILPITQPYLGRG